MLIAPTRKPSASRGLRDQTLPLRSGINATIGRNLLEAGELGVQRSTPLSGRPQRYVARQHPLAK
jgi:hypothetical protein